MPDKTKAFQKVKIFKQLKDRLSEEGLYREYAAEIDYLCLKKGYIIPMVIEAINNHKECEKAINTIINSLYADIPQIKSNKYYRRDIQSVVLLNAFTISPKVMSWILRLIYDRDPF